MKRPIVALALALVLGSGAFADSLADWAGAHSTTKVADLTVGDLKTLADLQSVNRQELWYVHSSSMASFLLPGLGQFKTGDALAGSLQVAGFVALSGASLYGAWTLLPADLRASGLSHDERRDLMRKQWNDDAAKLAPSLGVMAGGAALSLVYRFWSAGDAKARAVSNLETDKVVFEPAALDGHFGFRMRM